MNDGKIERSRTQDTPSKRLSLETCPDPKTPREYRTIDRSRTDDTPCKRRTLERGQEAATPSERRRSEISRNEDAPYNDVQITREVKK